MGIRAPLVADSARRPRIDLGEGPIELTPRRPGSRLVRARGRATRIRKQRRMVSECGSGLAPLVQWSIAGMVNYGGQLRRLGPIGDCVEHLGHVLGRKQRKIASSGSAWNWPSYREWSVFRMRCMRTVHNVRAIVTAIRSMQMHEALRRAELSLTPRRLRTASCARGGKRSGASQCMRRAPHQWGAPTLNSSPFVGRCLCPRIGETNERAMA